MNLTKKIIVLTISLSMLTRLASAQNWMPTSAVSNNWFCVASSADGTKLIAGAWTSSIYLSTNAGVTWIPTMTPNQYWSSVASSADGAKLIAAASYNSADFPGGVYTSTNSGTTWVSNSLPYEYWASVASSADGTKLVAAASLNADGFPPGAVFSSTNSGTSWVSNGLGTATSVASSADGSKVFLDEPLQLWRSTDFGITWTQLTNAPVTAGWVSPSQYIAVSADGKKLVAGVMQDFNDNPGLIYISTNSGDTWNSTSVPSNEWTFVASAADGRTLSAIGGGIFHGVVYVSTNAGTTWSSNNILNWTAVASSADGGRLVVAALSDTNVDVNSGGVYVEQSIQPPRIGISPATDNILLSWLIPSTNFVLQQSPDLFSWTDMTNAPALNLNNLNNQVVLPSTNGRDFYRLKLP